MNGIRFVHTDYWRLAGSIAGLASAPDWLRRLARDSTRGAVSRVFEVAATRDAGFVLVGGGCSDSPDYDSSVARWLQEPIHNLKRRGIRFVLAAEQSSAVDELADYVLRPGQRLHVTRSAGRLNLAVQPAASQTRADLVVSPANSGTSPEASCNYLFRPGVRYACSAVDARVPVWSAGSPQSHGPHEQGQFGCLVVEADSGSGTVETSFEATDPLRFETRTIDRADMVTSEDICEAVVNESLELGRQQRQTTVVDWCIDDPVDCVGRVESWHQDSMLETVRSTLQKGHLGVWPRRVSVSPPQVQISGESDTEGARELTSLLFQQPFESREVRNAAFAELVTGTQLLDRAA